QAHRTDRRPTRRHAGVFSVREGRRKQDQEQEGAMHGSLDQLVSSSRRKEREASQDAKTTSISPMPRRAKAQGASRSIGSVSSSSATRSFRFGRRRDVGCTRWTPYARA